MRLFSWLQRGEKRASPENPATPLSNAAEWLYDTLGATASASGISVNSQNALENGAVYACVRVIADTIGTLPLLLYQRLERGKERAVEHPLFKVLHSEPNSEMSSVVFRETLQAHLLLWGNAYAEIVRNGAGQVVELWPLLPDRTEVYRTSGRRFYTTRVGEGATVELRDEQVFHIPGLGYDGVKGYNPIRLLREGIAAGKAAEMYGAKLFANDARPGGVLQHPGRLSDEAYERLKKTWAQAHQGLSNAHRMAILEEGLAWQQTGLPPEDSQFLETRKFSVTEAARVFRVPPHMIGDLDKATFSNIEHQSLDFVVHTIRPWLVRWEQEINRKLLSDAGKVRYFAEHLVDGLLRGDIKSRYEAYSIARQNGWLSANDVRELENMNPIEGGDVYLSPLNMTPADDPEPEEEPEQNQRELQLHVNVDAGKKQARVERLKISRTANGELIAEKVVDEDSAE